jgi:hypothetical protein
VAIETVKTAIRLSFRVVMAVGFGLAAAVVAGTVCTMSGNFVAMGPAIVLAFLFGALGGWLRK